MFRIVSDFFQNLGTIRASGYITHGVIEDRRSGRSQTAVSIGNGGAVGRQLYTLFNVGTIRELTDGQLLERFATNRNATGELAFAALVERHGPMVLRVCRGVLADPNDTQDAFQATFLVLVRKARGLWVRESLGPWLYQVAYRTASCSRSARARRRGFERRAAELATERRVENDHELERALHEEIDRLPERYRAAVVLCDLESRTYEQAARHLGWPVGTVKSRLSRARQRLRDQLVRRGHAPAVGLLAAGRDATVTPALVDSTTGAAVQFVTARTLIPGSAVSLAQGVLRAMWMTRLLKLASVLIVLGASASGITLLAQKETTQFEPRLEGNVKTARKEDRPAFEVKPRKFQIRVNTRGVVEMSKSVDVYSAAEGLRTILFIEPVGSAIKKGQLVCELDASDLKKRLAELGDADDATVAPLRKQIENCKLYAPADGTLVRARNPKRVMVRERQLVFSLVNFKDPMRVNANVHESMIARVKNGQSAQIRIDAFAGETLTGTVDQVLPSPLESMFESRGGHVYSARVSIDKHPSGLRPGMTAEAEILLEERENVLSVPVVALIRYAGRDFTSVKKPDGGSDWREVTLGGQDGNLVEVKHGLESGEMVIINPLGLMSAQAAPGPASGPSETRKAATKPE